MKLARMCAAGPDGAEARILVADDPDAGWFDVRQAERLRLQRRGATPAAARTIASAIVPSSMAAALGGGDAFLDAARGALGDPSGDARVDGAPALTNALDPSAYRDFMAFDRHFSTGYKLLGREVPDVLYELPVSYFGNPLAFFGPEDTVPWPHYTRRMDYELELGIVIGRSGANLTPDEALDHVVGLTILNDFSARDIQGREMQGGLGPSKGKHFGCATGPWIATLDELDPHALRMRARVNGETLCDAPSSEAIWSLGELVAFASQGERVQPGMLLGSGTCNGGSTFELGRQLEPGDVVELEIEGLGVLRNVLGQPQEERWWPTAKTATGS
jgi:2-keto-4-pentenoate hydratase/2-oxohepta-3-ene-1,7-dioic acid hydratase in catechol pathway